MLRGYPIQEKPLISKTETAVGFTVFYMAWAGLFLVMCFVVFLYIEGIHHAASKMFG